MTDRPIFVVGFQRSGTTLLQSLLGNHPRIAAPPEVHFFFRVYDLRDYWGDLQDDERARAVLQELVHGAGSLLTDCGFDLDALVRRFAATDHSYAALLTALLDDFAARNGKVRWSEKTPHQRPAQVWSLLPDAQVVHIVRDPREVVASAVAAWPQGEPAWLLAERWRAFVTAADRDGQEAGGTAYLRVRYEDLAASPEAVLRQTCTFLGEDYVDTMLDAGGDRATAVAVRHAWQREAGHSVRPPRALFTERLSWHERVLVSSAVRGAVRWFGYPPAPRGSRALAAVLAPTRVPGQLQQRRLARTAQAAQTPEQRHALVQRFIADRQRMHGATAPAAGERQA